MKHLKGLATTGVLKTDEVLSTLGWSRVIITDLYNSVHGTSYQPHQVHYKNMGYRRLLAVANLGFSGNQFGILLYALQKKDSQPSVVFGNNINLDNSVSGYVGKSFVNLPFTTITQRTSEALYYYSLFEFI